jgi:hypothetical protein
MMNLNQQLLHLELFQIDEQITGDESIKKENKGKRD